MKRADLRYNNSYDYQSIANEIIDAWHPTYETESVPMSSLINEKNKSAFAKITRRYKAQLSAKKAKPPTFRAFRMVYLGLDLFLLQDVYNNTIAGRIVDFMTYLILGSGPRPRLKLRDESLYEDEEEMQEEIDNDEDLYQITDTLQKIDDSIGDPESDSPAHEHTFVEKMSGLCKNALTYGKGVNVRIVNDKGKIDLYPIHTRDIAYNVVNEQWKLEALLTSLSDEPYTLDNLIYAEWSPENPLYNTMYNGVSFMNRMLDSARALRRIKGTDMQLIAKKRWAGSAIIAMQKRQGSDDAAKLSSTMAAGNFVFSEEQDPEKAFHVHEIPLAAGSGDITDMATWLTHDCVAMGGIPTTLFYDESSANHSVFEIRIRAFQEQIDNEMRVWFGGILTKQWYMRNFKMLFEKDNPELLKKYKVVCEFGPIDFESMEVKVSVLDMLNRIHPLSAKYIGEALRIDNFESKIDKDREIDATEQQVRNLTRDGLTQQQKSKKGEGGEGGEGGRRAVGEDKKGRGEERARSQEREKDRKRKVGGEDKGDDEKEGESEKEGEKRRRKEGVRGRGKEGGESEKEEGRNQTDDLEDEELEEEETKKEGISQRVWKRRREDSGQTQGGGAGGSNNTKTSTSDKDDDKSKSKSRSSGGSGSSSSNTTSSKGSGGTGGSGRGKGKSGRGSSVTGSGGSGGGGGAG